MTTTAVAWAIALTGFEFPRRQSPEVESQTSAMAINGANGRATEALVFFRPDTGTGWTLLRTTRWPIQNATAGTITPRPQGGLYLDEPTYQTVAAIPEHRHPPTGNANSRNEFHLGWPLRSFWGASDTQGFGCFVNFEGTQHILRLRGGGAGWEIPFVRFDGRHSGGPCVPTGILPAGFAADTALFSIAWSALAFGILLTRRRLRLRRNHCPACNYDLSGTPASAPCPECGRTMHR
jgi:hypothetical protein